MMMEEMRWRVCVDDVERERGGKHYAIYVMLMLMMMMIMPSRDTFIDEVVLLASSY